MRRKMSRKEFLQFSMVGAGAALAAACGGTSGGAMQTPPAGNCLANGSTSQIGGNHGHVLVVTKADIAAGVAKTYDIQGSASHTHQVMLTAADMVALQKNMEAQETSTTDAGHSHSIAVICA